MNVQDAKFGKPVTAEQEARLENNFTYHAPKGDQTERYTVIREAAKAFAKVVMECSPASREQSLALTDIESAVMWANAAIARNE